jgi:hypothetical protein
METNQKIGQIMQALQMREEGEFVNGMKSQVMTITGEVRTELINALVKLLTE